MEIVERLEVETTRGRFVQSVGPGRTRVETIDTEGSTE